MHYQQILIRIIYIYIYYVIVYIKIRINYVREKKIIKKKSLPLPLRTNKIDTFMIYWWGGGSHSVAITHGYDVRSTAWSLSQHVHVAIYLSKRWHVACAGPESLRPLLTFWFRPRDSLRAVVLTDETNRFGFYIYFILFLILIFN